MKIGIYIGSFNPPHKGHIHIVNYLLDNKVVNQILIVPTGSYWNKQELTDIKDRISMLKLYETENIKIDSTNNNYPYTYELMRALSKQYPNDTLYLILGADNIVSFNKWKNYEELLQYPIIIMNRGNINIKEYTDNYPQGKFIILDDFIPIDISSTEIRNNISSSFLDKKVLRYIRKNNLYISKKEGNL